MIASPLLNLDEVARILQLSPAAVVALAEKGELPGGKVGEAWRFRRADVEKQRAFSAVVRPAAALEYFEGRRTVRDFLAPERVCLLTDCHSRDAALRQMCALFAQVSQLGDADEFTRQIFNREKILSTGIGAGVGAPHARLASITGTVMAVGISPPLADYTCVYDEQPVRVICMIAAPLEQPTNYLRLLAGIAQFTKNAAIREQLLTAPSAAAVFNIIATIEL
ncbi:PTS fructose transporter subunit IIA [Planctomycetales bacterium]|nr:PTS fructose transporter subunit IIA [Planctomycetales bacterium]